MSLSLIFWASQLPPEHFLPAERAVLKCLAEHADAFQRSVNSVDRIAAECSLTHRSVNRALRVLVCGGWITPDGTRGTVMAFKVNIDRSKPRSLRQSAMRNS